jgi:hypothetical protein
MAAVLVLVLADRRAPRSVRAARGTTPHAACHWPLAATGHWRLVSIRSSAGGLGRLPALLAAAVLPGIHEKCENEEVRSVYTLYAIRSLEVKDSPAHPICLISNGCCGAGAGSREQGQQKAFPSGRPIWAGLRTRAFI